MTLRQAGIKRARSVCVAQEFEAVPGQVRMLRGGELGQDEESWSGSHQEVLE